jgi:hypothetical protein
MEGKDLQLRKDIQIYQHLVLGLEGAVRLESLDDFANVRSLADNRLASSYQTFHCGCLGIVKHENWIPITSLLETLDASNRSLIEHL